MLASCCSRPMAAVKPGEEAARGALMAAHAAASLVPHSREAARLLRAAEGLLRSAVAVLTAELAKAKASAATSAEARATAGATAGGAAAATSGQGKSKSARRRRARKRRADAGPAAPMELSAPAADINMEAPQAASRLELQDSVVIGDLRELFGERFNDDDLQLERQLRQQHQLNLQLVQQAEREGWIRRGRESGGSCS